MSFFKQNTYFTTFYTKDTEKKKESLQFATKIK